MDNLVDKRLSDIIAVLSFLALFRHSCLVIVSWLLHSVGGGEGGYGNFILSSVAS